MIAVVAAVALGSLSPAIAQGLGAAVNGRAGARRPVGPDLSDVGIDQKLNPQLPLDLAFRDSSGQTVTLSQYFHGQPVILSLVYYHCAVLCPEVLRGMASSLKHIGFIPGKQYEVVTVSFDPRDDPKSSAEKKQQVLREFDTAGGQNGWHFLTGDAQSIHALTQAVGFRYKWDPQTQQFAHATAIMVLTPQGRVSKYFYGIDFKPSDLRFGLIQASDNKIGTLADEVLLFCCRFNATTGKYDWLAARIVAIGGLIILLSLGTFLALMFKLGPKRASAS